MYCSTAKLVDQVVDDSSSNALVIQNQAIMLVQSTHGVIDWIRALFSCTASHVYLRVNLSGVLWRLPLTRVKLSGLQRNVLKLTTHQSLSIVMHMLQLWQQKVVVFKGSFADALRMNSSWSQFWMYNCPGTSCPKWNPGGKGNPKPQVAQRSMSGCICAECRNMQKFLWQTMERFSRSKNADGKGFGKTASIVVSLLILLFRNL